MKTHISTATLAILVTACAGEECPSGFLDMGGTCIDLASDPANCGGFGEACAPGEICDQGRCVLSCPEGTTQCAGVCRDLASDDYNCGACGATCSSGFVCVDGSCVPRCPDGYTDCSGRCRNLQNDPTNCGECASACPAGEVCASGACSFTCPTPYVDCSGSCVDLDTDHLNCGECGNACASGQVCDGGSCANSCLAGLTMCSGACRDLMRDPENCGGCGTRCTPDEVCDDGACILGCVEGFTDCSGSCRDLDSDRLNCGACDNACLDGWVCNGGTCELSCAPPLVDCGGYCTDTDIDPRNCGACSTVCDETHAMAYCSSGACGLICNTGFGDCDSDVSTGCEANLMRDPANCGTCGTVCPTDEVCYLGICQVLTCIVVEDFEAGSWPVSPWVVEDSGGTVTTSAAHDGSYGILNPGWHYRTDIAIGPGSLLSTWVHTNTATGGRWYFGFDADSSGCKSFVMAPNTGDIRFQNNPGYGFTALTTVTQTFLADHWYLLEVEIGTAGVATGRLFDSDGGTLINTVSHDYGTIGTGGIAIRSFSDVGGDTITFCP